MKTTGSKDYLDMAEVEEGVFGFLDQCQKMESLLRRIDEKSALLLFLERGDKKWD